MDSLTSNAGIALITAATVGGIITLNTRKSLSKLRKDSNSNRDKLKDMVKVIDGNNTDIETIKNSIKIINRQIRLIDNLQDELDLMREDRSELINNVAIINRKLGIDVKRPKRVLISQDHSDSEEYTNEKKTLLYKDKTKGFTTRNIGPRKQTDSDSEENHVASKKSTKKHEKTIISKNIRDKKHTDSDSEESNARAKKSSKKPENAVISKNIRDKKQTYSDSDSEYANSIKNSRSKKLNNKEEPKKRRSLIDTDADENTQSKRNSLVDTDSDEQDEDSKETVVLITKKKKLTH